MSQIPRQPPAIGVPAWIRIPATDVLRAKQFYKEVFYWEFYDYPTDDEAAVEELAVFTIPGAPTLIGGISKVEVEEATGPRPTIDGAIMLYMKVESIKETLEKATSAGGMVVRQNGGEGDCLQMGEFRDTEGNLVGVVKWEA